MSARGAGLVLLLAALACPQAGAAPGAAEEFSSQVASRLLQQVTQGFISNNPGQVLSAFDAARMANYSVFRDNVQALFERYQDFRAAYRLRQTWREKDGGVVIAEFELEGMPLEEGSAPLRRNAQLRFEFQRGRGGWKIVGVLPRGFFS